MQTSPQESLPISLQSLTIPNLDKEDKARKQDTEVLEALEADRMERDQSPTIMQSAPEEEKAMVHQIVDQTGQDSAHPLVGGMWASTTYRHRGSRTANQ